MKFSVPSVLSVVLILFLTACAGDDRETLVIYSPHGKEMLSEYEQAFEQAHPDVDVQWLDMGGEQAYDRIRKLVAQRRLDDGERTIPGPDDEIFNFVTATGRIGRLYLRAETATAQEPLRTPHHETPERRAHAHVFRVDVLRKLDAVGSFYGCILRVPRLPRLLVVASLARHRTPAFTRAPSPWNR